MKKMLRLFLTITFVGIFAISSYAITWFPEEFTCPIDNEKNTFMVIGSYGSYIYWYPSKYQWVFFPNTSGNNFYMCKKCHLTTYMWDFDKIPKEKIPALKKLLADVKVSKDFKKYTEIPATERLEVMQKVYTVLETDDDWWEQFYRVKGYHYGAKGKEAKATEARKKSLEYLGKFLANEEYKDNKKLLLYISGAMKHFLGDDKGALEDLNKALQTKAQDSTGKATAEELKNYEEGMNERLKDYIEKINSKEKPRLPEHDKEADGHDDH
jgi:hypothetical protein